MSITDIMPNLIHDVIENAECKFHNIPDKFHAQFPATGSGPKNLTIKIPDVAKQNRAKAVLKSSASHVEKLAP